MDLTEFFIILIGMTCTFDSSVHCYSNCNFHKATEEKDAYINCTTSKEVVTSVSISFFTTYIPELNRSLFSPFPQAVIVDIPSNGVRRIQPTAFEDLNIQQVGLSFNYIKELEPGTFRSQKNITKIRLSYNQINHIPEGVFGEINKLEILELEGNKIKTIHEQAFIYLKELKRLNLSVNNIETLNENTFTNLFELIELDLHGNSIKNLPEGLFHNLNKLESLYLYYNSFKILPDKVFHNLGALKMLDISNNQIVLLQNNLFYKINRLKELKINSNNIHQLDCSAILVYLPDLIDIDLSNNLWRCEELSKIVNVLTVRHIHIVLPLRTGSEPNVEGLTCYDLSS